MTIQPPAPHHEPRTAPSLSTARIETLADGVFAIVMTLLVFGIVVPAQEQVNEIGLVAALGTIIPNLVSYFISFVILGVFWVGHHNQFFYIKRSDRTLLWINIVFMMFVALVPFSAALLSRYGSEQISVIIYDINLILCGLALYWHWIYGTRDNHLTHIPVEPHIRSMVIRRILLPPAFYLLGIVLSFVRTEVSIAMDILIPLLYVLPTNIDQAFRR